MTIKMANSTLLNHQALCLAIANDNNYKLDKYKKQIKDEMKDGNNKEKKEEFVHNSHTLQLGY